MSILGTIIDDKKVEVAGNKAKLPFPELKEALKQMALPNNRFRKLLDVDLRFHFIAEVKKASPSKGVIRADFDPVAIAAEYEEAGASAVSVLTDHKYFAGHIDHLKQIRQTTSLPLLRKDFIIDVYQIYESKQAGADMILLIARCLSAKQLYEFCAHADRLQLDVLVEIAESNEIDKLPPPAPHILVGINNRNLNTFEVDFNRSLRLRDALPKDVPAIGESGIQSPEDCRRLYNAGFRGVLIGETLMRSKQPGKMLRSFIQGVQNAQAS